MMFQQLKTVTKNSYNVTALHIIEKMAARELGALFYCDRILDHKYRKRKY